MEAGFDPDGDDEWGSLVITEVDYALRPHVHERRVPSVGAIIEPTTPPDDWEAGSQLLITRRPVDAMPLNGTRLFADGLSSWLLRREDGDDEWLVFDRPAGSERDLVVLAETFGATIVQRHPSGVVRVVGAVRRAAVGRARLAPRAAVGGVDRRRWPPATLHGDRDVLETLLEFAVHDLGARGIGAILVYRPDGDTDGLYELRLPPPPPLDVRRAFDLAPLRHALTQVDGAAVLDGDGILRQLGVRLVPSPEAEAGVEGYRGMRHTSGRRYSYDDPLATVIVVSEDGPGHGAAQGRADRYLAVRR